MNTEVGFGRKVLGVLEDFRISFEHIPTGIDTMSVVVATAAIADCKDALIGRISGTPTPIPSPLKIPSP